MGAVKTDLSARERALEETFPALNTSVGIKRLLGEQGALEIRQYAGDYDAVLLLIDLKAAISKAKLTERQSEAIRLVYEADLTQEEAARQAGVARDNLKRRLDVAVEKIAAVYEYWGWHGEGYSIANNETEEINND
ncbi:sigma factor-like helix-turn-helix DNA-binding protein [Priestia megaterium]|uniref:sigma factor-like helix-turn-helix DNA-binding protein n=1 Tax=Priestia megaterium TaxID=1404 RepID=UPI00345AEB32